MSYFNDRKEIAPFVNLQSDVGFKAGYAGVEAKGVADGMAKGMAEGKMASDTPSLLYVFFT